MSIYLRNSSVTMKYIDPNFKTTRDICKVCGHINFIKPTDGSDKRCGGCKNLMYQGTDTFHTDEDPDASYSTHNQIRWGCRECGHTGIKWVKKGNKLNTCPNCGKEPFRLAKGIIDPKGSCATIWEPVQGIRRPLIKPLSKKRKECRSCGNRYSYLVKLPKSCPRCGHHW